METNTQTQAFLFILWSFYLFEAKLYITAAWDAVTEEKGCNSNMKFCRSCFPLTHRVRGCFCICLALVLAFVSYGAAFHDFWPLIGSHRKASPPDPVVLHPSTYPAHSPVMFYLVPPYIFFQGTSSPQTGLRSHPFLCCCFRVSLCSLFLCYTALLTFVYKTSPQGSLL